MAPYKCFWLTKLIDWLIDWLIDYELVSIIPTVDTVVSQYPDSHIILCGDFTVGMFKQEG